MFLHACRVPIQKAGGGPQAAAARKEALRSKQVLSLSLLAEPEGAGAAASVLHHRAPASGAPVCVITACGHGEPDHASRVSTYRLARGSADIFRHDRQAPGLWRIQYYYYY